MRDIASWMMMFLEDATEYRPPVHDSLNWEWKCDPAKRWGPHPAVKMMCALRQLVDGSLPFQVADTYHLSETTAGVCLKEFCKDMIRIHGPVYLQPDFEKSLRSAKIRGYDGYLGSLDCTHIGWHACPRAFAQGSSNSSSPSLNL